MQKIIFHLGTPKTGTSIIQSHLAQNRAVLRDMGYFYPVTISSDKRLYKTYESHHLLTYSVAGWQPFSDYSPTEFMRRVEKTSTEYNLHTLLLSAENTYWLPRQIVSREKPSAEVYWQEKKEYMTRFRELFSGYDTELVIYLRRQDRWLESWYNQQIKNGNSLPRNVYSFAEHCEYLLDYRKYLELLSEVFGKDHIKVRVYEKQQLPDGLFSDFVQVSGLGDPENFPLREAARYNSQLLPEALEFMHICNSLEGDAETRRELRLMIRKVTRQFESEIVFKEQHLLDNDDRLRLIDKYQVDNQWIAEEFLKRGEEPLFVEPVKTVDSDASREYHINTQQAVRIIMQLFLENMSKQRGTGHTDHKKIRKSLSVLSDLINVVFKPLKNRLRVIADERVWEENLWAYEKV